MELDRPVLTNSGFARSSPPGTCKTCSQKFLLCQMKQFLINCCNRSIRSYSIPIRAPIQFLFALFNSYSHPSTRRLPVLTTSAFARSSPPGTPCATSLLLMFLRGLQPSGFGVWGLGFGVEDFRFRVQDLKFRVYGLGIGV